MVLNEVPVVFLLLHGLFASFSAPLSLCCLSVFAQEDTDNQNSVCTAIKAIFGCFYNLINWSAECDAREFFFQLHIIELGHLSVDPVIYLYFCRYVYYFNKSDRWENPGLNQNINL